jgi:hypothetical protein
VKIARNETVQIPQVILWSKYYTRDKKHYRNTIDRRVTEVVKKTIDRRGLTQWSCGYEKKDP